MISSDGPSDLCSILIIRKAFFCVDELSSACPECPPLIWPLPPEPREEGQPLGPQNSCRQDCFLAPPSNWSLPCSPQSEFFEAARARGFLGRMHTFKALFAWKLFSEPVQWPQSIQIRRCNSEGLAREKSVTTES